MPGQDSRGEIKGLTGDVMQEFFKKFRERARKEYLIASLVYLALGLMLVLLPFDRMDEFLIVNGAVLLAAGIFMLVMGMTGDKKADSWPLGAVLVVLAVFILVRYRFLIGRLYLPLGLAVLAGGVIDLYHYLRIRYTYGEPEILPILVSAVSAVLGVVILLHPFEETADLLRFAGAVFLGRGVLSYLYYRRMQEKN